MKHFTIAGNWKMNQTPEEAGRFVKRLQERVKPHTHVTSVVCVPFVDLGSVAQTVEPDLLHVGAQNIHEVDEGAYTGEISGPMLKGLAEYVIIGHSERRHFEHETDKRIAKKLAAAIRSGLKPILCVGEKLDDREDGHAIRVVVDQLHGCLSHITADEVVQILIAYEPIWAIGTGKAATPKLVAPVVAAIHETITEMFSAEVDARVEVLYGGSANPDNARSFLEMKGINGLLPGSASLNYEHFAAMIDIAAQLSDAR